MTDLGPLDVFGTIVNGLDYDDSAVGKTSMRRSIWTSIGQGLESAPFVTMKRPGVVEHDAHVAGLVDVAGPLLFDPSRTPGER